MRLHTAARLPRPHIVKSHSAMSSSTGYRSWCRRKPGSAASGRMEAGSRPCRHPKDRRNPRYPDAMPETRVERILFGVAALVIAALVALIVLETTDRFGARDAPAAPAPASTTTAPVTTTAPEATGNATAAPEQAPLATNHVRLRLSATADTWVEIRSGSAAGDVLYSGILPQGTAKRFSNTRLWASFGAASNLTARLNGKPLHLPPGTYSALVGARGLQPPGD
jgi:Domain of unknown function (DUF4115)